MVVVRDYSFISLTQSLLRNKSRQVLGKGREIFCLEDTDGQVLADKTRGIERDKLLLMAGKRSFCVDLSQGKWPSQEVCTGLLLKHPGMSRRQQKMENKRGSNNHNGGS